MNDEGVNLISLCIYHFCDVSVNFINGSYINNFYIEAENSMSEHLDSLSVADMDSVVRPRIIKAISCE